MAEPRIAIVGGGFAGIEVAKALKRSGASVLLIDRQNYFLFQPLLYQIAAAALSPADIAVPFRALLQGTDTEILLDEVVGLDLAAALVKTSAGREIAFDFLVLATGSHYNYFGHNEWAQLAPAPKTIEAALEIRCRLLLAFEEADMCTNDDDRRAMLTFVIVGAGPTGVEIAGAIAELARESLVRGFRRIGPASVSIVLIDADTKVLSSFPDTLGAYAHQELTRLGVQVLLNMPIEHIDRTGVVAGGRRLDAGTVIWAAGVVASPVVAWLGMQPGPRGTVGVNPDFSVPTHPNVFVIGDAAMASGADGSPLPGLAAVAKQEGQYVGNLISRRLTGDDTTHVFRYRDFGTMATIGRSAAVANIRGFKLTGVFAWLLWGCVHIYSLIGFRNRLLVLVVWFWAWLTRTRGTRLITGNTASRSAPEPHG